MTNPSGGNPAPRAALRKAADATVHPAAGFIGGEPHQGDSVPPRSHIAAVPPSEGSPEPAADRNPTDGAPLRPVEPPKGKGATRAAAKGKGAGRKFRGATSDVLRHPEPRERDILLGKQVSLQVQVPKRLRKAARAQAQRQGTTIDEVVTGLLAGWVDGS